MKSFTFLPRVILGLLLFVTGGGISLAKDVTNTVNGTTTYTFKVTSTKDKTANVSLSKIDGTDLASYTGTDIDLKTAYPSGTYTSGDTLYTITSMEAMRGNTTIKTVEMPSTVTSLPWYCFDGCTSLTTVSFPGLTSLPKYCFQECKALTTFSIPSIQSIGDNAFQNCSALTGTLTIPSGAYVGNRAFYGCTGVTTLVIHTGTKDNATSFWGYAFSNMSGVTEVKIVNDGSDKIPDNTFKGAVFNANVTHNIDKEKDITTIGKYAFSSANFPTNLDLSKFTFFDSHAFEGNTTLANKDVTFADNTTIGEAAFSGCTLLSGTLTIPKGASVAYQAFNNCSGITSIVLHSGMTSGEHDHNGCFMKMSKVNSVSIIDDGNNTIPANVFGCASFSTAGVDLTIPVSITAIGDGAFYSANFPTKLDLSNQFTSYGASAFEDNTAFKGNNGDGIFAVKKPKSATSDVTVDSKAFWNTGATEIDIYPNVDYSACKPSDAYYEYGHGPYNGTSITKIVFESSITSIPDYLFFNASAIPKNCLVTWPTKPITHIGNGAFCGVQFTAAIPSEMKDGTIGEYAYAHNGMYDEITIPDGCKEIGKKAFYDCDKITGVTVPASTTSIGASAFADCALLAALNLPEGTDSKLVLGGSIIDNDPVMKGITITNAVSTIYSSYSNSSNNTFSGLIYSPFTVTLKSDKVTATKGDASGTFFSFKNNGTPDKPNTLNVVADGVTTIPADMFSESSSLSRTSSNINVLNISGSSLKEIKSGAFQDNQELTFVDLSGAPNLRTIDDNAFSNCSMTSIKFGTDCDIETIGKSAFESCSRLESINIGNVKTLGEYAFNNCSKLAKINQTNGKNDLRGSTLTSIGQYTFGGCKVLANLYLPSTLMRISNDAFKDALAAKNSAVYVQAIANNKFTTYSRGFGLTPTTDASVWTISSIDKANKKVILTQASTMPSGDDYPNGYVFYNNSGSQQSYDFPVIFEGTTVSKATSYGTSMKGTLDGKTFTDDESKYCYFVWSTDMKLHPVLANTTLPAGKAYFEGEKTESAKAYQGFAFVLDYNWTTDIKGVKEEQHNELGNDYYYDLGGRKVENPSEGIYIHHGKKVIVTKSL